MCKRKSERGVYIECEGVREERKEREKGREIDREEVCGRCTVEQNSY